MHLTIVIFFQECLSNSLTSFGTIVSQTSSRVANKAFLPSKAITWDEHISLSPTLSSTTFWNRAIRGVVNWSLNLRVDHSLVFLELVSLPQLVMSIGSLSHIRGNGSLIFLPESHWSGIRRESHLTVNVRTRDWSANFALRTLIAPDLLLVEARIVALGSIFCEDVRAISIVRQELVNHQWRLHHALIDVCSLVSHRRRMLLAWSEKEWVLVARRLSPCNRVWHHCDILDMNRNLLAEKSLLCTKFRLFIHHGTVLCVTECLT